MFNIVFKVKILRVRKKLLEENLDNIIEGGVIFKMRRVNMIIMFGINLEIKLNVYKMRVAENIVKNNWMFLGIFNVKCEVIKKIKIGINIVEFYFIVVLILVFEILFGNWIIGLYFVSWLFKEWLIRDL